MLSSIIGAFLSIATFLEVDEKKISSQKDSLQNKPKNISVTEKKRRFFALLVPAIQQVYSELQQQYIETKALVETDPTNEKVLKLMKEYNAKTPQNLLVRMKPHPKSIALAQSAMESAWGTSRFFKEANNVFGVWSFNKNEPRIPASQKRGNTTIYIKKYNSIHDSIRDYYKVLATKKAFKEFRKEKMETNDPDNLVKYLDKYSERGDEYGKELKSMIRHNKLKLYDK